MKIVDFQTLVLGTTWRNLTYLVIELEDGTRGYGETRITSKTHTLVHYLQDQRRHIIGHDVRAQELLRKKFTRVDFGVAHEVEMSGLALVEMACWDALGKVLGLPVYQFVGGAVRETIPAYANGWYQVEREPEAFAAAARAVQARGYRGLKFDPFGAGDMELSREEFHRSIDLIEAVHASVGATTQIHLEMHGRFSAHQAIEIARRIAPLEPAWIEEPCPPEDLGALRRVAQHVSLPIATGERLYSADQFRDLFEMRCVDIIQPDLSQCGGFLEAKKIASTAETYSIMVAPHNVGGIITTAASLHLLATLRNGKILEHFNDFADEFVKQAGSPYPEVVDGMFSLPQGPGWGVELDLDFIRAHEPGMVDGVIQDPGLNMFHHENWHKRGRT